STKRLRTTICMTRPAMAMDAPASTSARVRGMRLISSTSSARPSAPPARSEASDTSLTPTNRLTAARTTEIAKAMMSAGTKNRMGRNEEKENPAARRSRAAIETAPPSPPGEGGAADRGMRGSGRSAVEAVQHLVEQQHHALIAVHGDIGGLRVEINDVALLGGGGLVERFVIQQRRGGARGLAGAGG